MTSPEVLVLNSGSSSLKWKLFAVTRGAQPDGTGSNLDALAGGIVEAIGTKGSSLTFKALVGADPPALKEQAPVADHTAALHRVFAFLKDAFGAGAEARLAAIGHRVVHGGESTDAALVDAETIGVIEDAIALAPLHNRANLAGINAAKALFPALPQAVVFDTAFHHTLPPSAFMYALPYELAEQNGIRKYGFHGTSYRYLLGRTAEVLKKPREKCNLIVAHLGAGSSMCAIRNGRSVDTTMGFTPLEGLMMGSRSGDVDPAVVCYMQNTLGMAAAEVDTMLNKASGLKGIAGSLDLRDVFDGIKEGNKRCQLALDMLVHSVRKYLGAYMLDFGAAAPLDAIVFSAGAGENAAALRRLVVADLAAYGIALDDARNAAVVGGAEGPIHAADSRVALLVLHTDEELEIGKQTVALARVAAP